MANSKKFKLRVFLTRYEKEEGETLPWGYAIAYRDFCIDRQVSYPIGIHFIVRWSRDLLFWISYVGYPGYRQRIEHEAWLKGRAFETKRLHR